MSNQKAADLPGDKNHADWLETVPPHHRIFVGEAVATWNSQADEFNQWGSLGWDERTAALRTAADETCAGADVDGVVYP